MIRLTQLQINRFRNVKPGQTLSFGPTFNVLLGKNATGKSTLLELIAAVTHDDLSPFASEDEGFDLTWWLELEENRLEIHAVRTPASGLGERLRGEAEFDDTLTIVMRVAGTDAWRVEVEGAHLKWMPVGEAVKSFEVRTGLAVKHATLRALWTVLDAHPGVPGSPAVNAALAAKRMRPLFLGSGRYDEALGSFSAIVGARFETNRDGKMPGGGSYGEWLTSEFVLAADEPASGTSLVIPFEKLGSLSEAPRSLGFATGEVRPRVLSRSQEGERATTRYSGIDCLFRRKDGSEISHELLSFGQKRLFSFLWYVALHRSTPSFAPGDAELPLVADELLNGLHHEWIELCFDQLRAGQSFLSTQHPLLLDHIPVESVEGVLKTFVRCTLVTAPSGHEQMAWRNFDQDEAARFFAAHQTGIQQVSEVLRTEGLW